MSKHQRDESRVLKVEPKRQKFSAGSRVPKITQLKNADDVNQFWTFKQFQGQGSFGTVVSGIRAEFASHVALKTIYNQGKQKTKPDPDVLREISYLQQCQGTDHVCQIIDSFFSPKHLEQQAQTLIFMELYDTSLYHYLGQPTGLTLPPLQDKLDCFNLAKDHISQGLLTLHKLGILHRDLSTKNIFIKLDPATKSPYHFVIGDLGMARQLSIPWIDANSTGDYDAKDDIVPPWIDTDEDDLLSLNVTTVTYRAPELLLGATSYSWPIDYWSFGIILYDVLVRQHPFEKRGKRMGKNDQRNFKKVIWPFYDSPIDSDSSEARERPKTPKDLTLCDQKPTWTSHVLKTYPTDALEAINSLLILNPKKRLDFSSFRQNFVSQ